MKLKLKVSRKQNSVLSSNVINFLPAWQTDFSFESQHQGIGDIKISNCHVYGMADMTVCMVPDIWERRGLVHNCTQLLRSCWRRMCLWLLMVITRDIQHFTTHSNLESGLLVNCLRDQLCHIGIMDPTSGAILNTSLFQLYKEWVYAKRGIGYVRIRFGLRTIY